MSEIEQVRILSEKNVVCMYWNRADLWRFVSPSSFLVVVGMWQTDANMIILLIEQILKKYNLSRKNTLRRNSLPNV